MIILIIALLYCIILGHFHRNVLQRAKMKIEQILSNHCLFLFLLEVERVFKIILLFRDWNSFRLSNQYAWQQTNFHISSPNWRLNKNTLTVILYSILWKQLRGWNDVVQLWQSSWVDTSLELVKSTSFTSFNAFVTPPDKQQTKIGLWFLPRTSSSRKPPQFQSKHLSRPMFLTWESQVFNKEELSGLSPMIDRQKAFLHELWSFKGTHNF